MQDDVLDGMFTHTRGITRKLVNTSVLCRGCHWTRRWQIVKIGNEKRDASKQVAVW